MCKSRLHSRPSPPRHVLVLVGTVCQLLSVLNSHTQSMEQQEERLAQIERVVASARANTMPERRRPPREGSLSPRAVILRHHRSPPRRQLNHRSPPQHRRNQGSGSPLGSPRLHPTAPISLKNLQAGVCHSYHRTHAIGLEAGPGPLDDVINDPSPEDPQFDVSVEILISGMGRLAKICEDTTRESPASEM